MKSLTLFYVLFLACSQASGATLSITIPNAVVNRSTAAFCGAFNYQPTINGQPNPETPIQFTQRMIADFIRNTVITFESGKAAHEAYQSKKDSTTTDVGGIQ